MAEIRGLAAQKPDVEKFPMWNAQLQADMETETRMFFDAILRENRPVSEFLTADYSFLNARLARHYGIQNVQGPEFRRVQLDPAQRGGIFTHGSVLTLTSYPVRTSPVLRGKYILDVFSALLRRRPGRCARLDEAVAGTPASLREALSKHRADQFVRRHSRMDPLGFGLETTTRSAAGERKKISSHSGRRTLPNGVVLRPRGVTNSPCTGSAGIHTESDRKDDDLRARTGILYYDRVVIRDIVSKVIKSEYRFQTLFRKSYRVFRSKLVEGN